MIKNKQVLNEEVIEAAFNIIGSGITNTDIKETFEDFIDSIIIAELNCTFNPQLQQKLITLGENLQVATLVMINPLKMQSKEKLLNFMLLRISTNRKQDVVKLLLILNNETKQNLIEQLSITLIQSNKYNDCLILLSIFRRQGISVENIAVPANLNLGLNQKLIVKALPQAIGKDKWLLYLYCEDVLTHPNSNIVPVMSIIEELRKEVKTGTLSESRLNLIQSWTEYVLGWQKGIHTISELYNQVTLLTSCKLYIKQELQHFYNLEKFKHIYPRTTQCKWIHTAIQQSFQYKYIDFHIQLCDCTLSFN